MGPRAAAALVGIAFGFTLSWSGMTDPDVIRGGLLLESAYLFLFFASALGTAFAGSHLLRRGRARALVTGEPVGWQARRPERRHVTGSVLFGVGWSLAASCPGPIAAQLGDGVLWSLATIAGLVIGLRLYALQRPAASPEPVAVTAGA